jgi:Fe-S cluster biogenesis protein NfuA
LFSAVRKIIDTDLRPYVQADGGDIELVAIEGQRVKVRLTGACTTCPSSPSTLREGVEARLRAMISDALRVEEVQ